MRENDSDGVQGGENRQDFAGSAGVEIFAGNLYYAKEGIC